MLRILAVIAPSTAASRSASANTRNGAFPPSSIDVRSTLSAACSSSARPTSVDPVNDSLRARPSRISGSMTLPALPVVTTLSTPSGRPASARIAARASIDSGVCWAGLITIVQPAATAGPILRVPMAMGKFHGVTSRHDADGLAHDQEPARAVRGRRVLAVDAHGLLGEPPEELRRVGDLALRLGERLAHLHRHEQGEVVDPRRDQLVRAAQDLPAFARGHRREARLGGDGGVERGPPVVRRRVRHLDERLARGGVVDGQRGPQLAGRQEPPMNKPGRDGVEDGLLPIESYGVEYLRKSRAWGDAATGPGRAHAPSGIVWRGAGGREDGAARGPERAGRRGGPCRGSTRWPATASRWCSAPR